MSERERNKAHGWNKTYVVYNERRDILGIHKGAKFVEIGDDVYYWPHDIDFGGRTSLMCDESFQEDIMFIGVL